MLDPTLTWNWGTGYDLFVSLHVLHHADDFGLRSSWAAGVRSRLDAGHRAALEEAQDVCSLPLNWIYTLPEPKDAASVLQVLSDLPPRERLAALAAGTNTPRSALHIYRQVAERGSWEASDLSSLKQSYQDADATPRTSNLESALDIWREPGLFGERYLSALQAYHSAFFAEEETRIKARLTGAVEEAKTLAARLPFDELIETLSRGLRFGTDLDIQTLVLVPSYWITPLIVYRELSDTKGLFLFGARQETESLVPGEQVPETMLRALKSLADPTRLRILRYLEERTMAPSELAQRLRLRASTVTHHLKILRLAGLVYLTLENKHKKRYATRQEAIHKTITSLHTFLETGMPEKEHINEA